MTTAAPPTTSADIKAVYELPPPYLRVKIRYAHLHRRTDIYDEIFQRECPRVPLHTVPRDVRLRMGWSELDAHVKTNERYEPGREVYRQAYHHPDLDQDFEAGDPKMEYVYDEEEITVPDPDVLWVGRFSDGLVALEIVESRKLYKSFVHSIKGGRGQPGGVDSQCQIVFQRPGERPINFSDIVLDAEPGEMIHSPADVPMSEDGQPRSLFHSTAAGQSWNTAIRIDPDYGLHYLKRGDVITLRAQGWPKPMTHDGNPYEMKWILRPVSEGPSYVAPRTGEEDMIQLGAGF